MEPDLTGGFAAQASKQLAGEWQPFKRRGDEEILIQLWVFPHGGVIFTTSLQSVSFSLPEYSEPISSVSIHTEDNFLKAAVGKRGRGERGREKNTGVDRK